MQFSACHYINIAQCHNWWNGFSLL